MEYALLYEMPTNTYAIIHRNNDRGDKYWTYYQTGLREEVAEALLKGLTS